MSSGRASSWRSSRPRARPRPRFAARLRGWGTDLRNPSARARHGRADHRPARVEAEDRLEVSHREAAQIAAVGEQRRRDLDADTDRIWAERLRIVEDARGLAGQLIALAESSTERFPPAGPEVTAEPKAEAEPDAVAELWAAAAGRAADHDGRRCYRRSDRLGTLRRPRTNSNPADVNRERGRSPRGLPLPSRAAARLRCATSAPRAQEQHSGLSLLHRRGQPAAQGPPFGVTSQPGASEC